MVLNSFFGICNSWIIKCGKSYRWFGWSSNCPSNIGCCMFRFYTGVTGNIVFSEYLQIPYIEGTGEVSFFVELLLDHVWVFMVQRTPGKILWVTLVRCL